MWSPSLCATPCLRAVAPGRNRCRSCFRTCPPSRQVSGRNGKNRHQKEHYHGVQEQASAPPPATSAALQPWDGIRSTALKQSQKSKLPFFSRRLLSLSSLLCLRRWTLLSALRVVAAALHSANRRLMAGIACHVPCRSRVCFTYSEQETPPCFTRYAQQNPLYGEMYL